MRFRCLSLAVGTDPKELDQVRHLFVAPLAQLPLPFDGDDDED